METKGYYAMSFYNTTDTMQTEKKAKALFPIQVMPTPRAISQSCGLALRFEGGDGAGSPGFALPFVRWWPPCWCCPDPSRSRWGFTASSRTRMGSCARGPSSAASPPERFDKKPVLKNKIFVKIVLTKPRGMEYTDNGFRTQNS